MRDLEELAVTIAEDSEQAAESVEARIHQEASLLSRFPRSGRPGRVAGTRERVVGRTPIALFLQRFASCAFITPPANGPRISDLSFFAICR